MEFAIFPMLLLAAVVAINTAVAIWAGEFVARRIATPDRAHDADRVGRASNGFAPTFPIGFPWNLLGYTAYRNLALIQFAEFTGVYGVSALIVFFNAVVYVVIFRRGAQRLQTVSLSVLTAMMIAAWRSAPGASTNSRTRKPTGSFKVAMVQGNIPQSLKWDPNFLPQTFGVYQDQTAEAAKRGADLIVWPEAAAAFLFQPDDHYPAVLARTPSYRTALLTLAQGPCASRSCSAHRRWRAHDGRLGFHNRAYLVSARPGRSRLRWYDKIQLVPFGEYVPARACSDSSSTASCTAWAIWFPAAADALRSERRKTGVLICYESIFPDLARRAVKEGADVLVNITNDAWYGDSSAPYQLLAMAAMRSVETKVPMVRVANTGISAMIDPSADHGARRCSSAAPRSRTSRGVRCGRSTPWWAICSRRSASR